MPTKPYTTAGFDYNTSRVSDDLDTIKNNFEHLQGLLIASATAPTNATTGQLWFDANTGIIKEFDGTNWVDVVASPNLSNVADLDILNKLKNVDGIGSGLDADLFQGQPKSDFLLRQADFDSGWFLPSRSTNNIITLAHNLGTIPSEVRLIKHNLDTGEYYIAWTINARSDTGTASEYQNPMAITFDVTNIYLHIYSGQYLWYYWKADGSGWQVSDNVEFRVLAWK